MSPTKDESEKCHDDNNESLSDSKTLKYKYQTAQNELRQKIETLESLLVSNDRKVALLEKQLHDERNNSHAINESNQSLKSELESLKKQCKESQDESQVFKEQISELLVRKREGRHSVANVNQATYQQLVNVEEELVTLKERYAQINEEKTKLLKEFSKLKDQYNQLCNSSYDKMYWYMAPLILIILYLVISAMIS